jgi:hypothetical protein
MMLWSADTHPLVVPKFPSQQSVSRPVYRHHRHYHGMSLYNPITPEPSLTSILMRGDSTSLSADIEPTFF